MNLAVNVELTERRCVDCRRWYATERSSEWRCGSCAHVSIQELNSEIAHLLKSNAALRGALKRRKKR